ncbi:hypothetical protein HAX54_032839 [Datura stramonium]|uniref:Uncharacterized protein n=1 Tax=Datura stramonium TaxID=4076 RepID=A0ABS8VE23_DATST|nr:hypothetical protein [Datura stramonium]
MGLRSWMYMPGDFGFHDVSSGTGEVVDSTYKPTGVRAAPAWERGARRSARSAHLRLLPPARSINALPVPPLTLLAYRTLRTLDMQAHIG